MGRELEIRNGRAVDADRDDDQDDVVDEED